MSAPISAGRHAATRTGPSEADSSVDMVRAAVQVAGLLDILPDTVRFGVHRLDDGSQEGAVVSITVDESEHLFRAARNYPAVAGTGLARFGSGLCWVGEVDGVSVLLHTERTEVVEGEVVAGEVA